MSYFERSSQYSTRLYDTPSVLPYYPQEDYSVTESSHLPWQSLLFVLNRHPFFFHDDFLDLYSSHVSVDNASWQALFFQLHPSMVLHIFLVTSSLQIIAGSDGGSSPSSLAIVSARVPLASFFLA